MEINELQIGDWVEVGGIPRQIKLIDDCINHKIIAHGVNDDGRTIAYVGKLNEEVKPIPLTPEILEKNGFVIESRYCHSNSLQYCVLVDGLWIDISGENYFEGKLENVHQLQHTIRLCGIEKEITL
jgi:hypothetical protein